MSAAAIFLLVIACAGLWVALDVRNRGRFRVLFLAFAAMFYSPICGAVLHLWDVIFPIKFDASLYRIDSAIGISSFMVARALCPGWTGILLGITYMLLLPMMVFWCAIEAHYRWRGPSILWAYFLEMFCALGLYALVPACGPIYASPGFPFKNPSFVSTGSFGGAPNAIPSLHVSTALLLMFFARGKPWKAISFIFLLGIILSTLTTGEHYVIDLIVAVPFACFITSAVRRRFVFATACLSTTLVLMMLIRMETGWLSAHPDWLRVGLMLLIAGCALEISEIRPLAPSVAARPMRSRDFAYHHQRSR